MISQQSPFMPLPHALDLTIVRVENEFSGTSGKATCFSHCRVFQPLQFMGLFSRSYACASP